MKAKLIEIISTILINLFSSTTYDTGKIVLEAHQAKRFQKDLQIWLEKFFSTHIELVFETSAFYTYMEYQNPCRKIAQYLLGTSRDEEKVFLNQLGPV